MRRNIKLLLLLMVCNNCLVAQNVQIYPSNWWTGMKWNKLQLMLHGNNIGASTGFSINYPGVQLQKINKVENKNYVFLDLLITATAKPGIIKIIPKGVEGLPVLNFELKAKRTGNGTTYAQGVRASDFVYLLMPDRFSNGDSSNDRITGMKDQSLNRDSIYDRHGGDLQGVINHLDYLQDLGVTTVWMTPIWENDMPNRTEHGYAITNHYKVEPRFGGNEMYKKLSDAVHQHGMKIIQDAVYNHVGLYHFTVQDMPMKSWLNQWPQYTNTTYKDQSLFDPYASIADIKKMSNGWFTTQMPDLNQTNPYVANFLIQHALWSVEEFGVDGWRIDTYIYNDLPFMNRCNKALMDEYPNISMFGETWVHGVINQSYFCENNFNIGFKSNLQATTDFQTLFYGIQETLTKPFGWTDGVNKLYTTAAQDFVYKQPMNQVIFMDNHDLSRFYSVVEEDTAKYKLALAWLLTFRGIPQLYYGDEILMTGFTNPDGLVRLDFKGGWKGDVTNKFTAAGRTDKENNIFNYVKTIANFRKNSTAIKTGKMMQYAPENGVYVYFRYSNQQTVMCVMNTNNEVKELDTKRFAENIKAHTKGRDIVSGNVYQLNEKITVSPMTLLVLNIE